MRCRVTLYDREQDMKRRLEVEAASTLAAAEAALRWQIGHGCAVEDFGKVVEVEVITTVAHRLSMATVAARLEPKKAMVA